jgi:hypothetical protein
VFAGFPNNVDWEVRPVTIEGFPYPEVGEVFLFMGTKPFDMLKSAGLAAKNKTLNSQRGFAFSGKNTGHWMLSFDPTLTQIDPSKKQEITWDIRLAERLHRTGSLEPPLGKYGYTDTLRYVRAYVEQEHKKTGLPVPVTCDTETMGFYPWEDDKELVSISFTVAPGYADVVYLYGKDPAPFMEDLEWLLTSPKVKLIGANFKFDLLWLRKKLGLKCTNFKSDTLLMGSLLDENRSNSLPRQELYKHGRI